MSELRVRRLSASEADAYVEPLAEVLIDCVEGGASVSFMLPMTREKALTFWRKVAEGVKRGERALIVAEDAPGEVLGTVQLILALPENQPHRADVAKMLVHRRARRQGVAAKSMEVLEQEARRERRNVLVLDTVTGSDAERVYQRAGWTRVGDVPEYALMPSGERCSTTFYFKRL